jgi:hypothetical protein
MLTAPTAPWTPAQTAVEGSTRPACDPAPVGCGGWYASSAELRQGVEVLEHDGWPDAGNDTLWDVLSFE